jgi:predicted outer membrane protein
MNRLPILLAALLASALLCAAAPEDGKSLPTPILSTELTGADLAYFTGAARQAALIIRLSDLAKSRAVTPEVQSLAAAVFNDQTAFSLRLQTLAARKQASLADASDHQAEQLLQTLSGLKGARLDKSYLDPLADAQDHLEPVLATAASSLDPDNKAAAQSALDTLKQERARVRKLGL